MKLKRISFSPFRRLKIIFVIIPLISACNWFEPREAEKPWEEESDWQEPVSPSVVISNLKLAFEGRNIVNYASSFSPDFIFFGDPADSPYVEPGIFNDWNYEVEIDVTTKLFNTFNNIGLLFEDSTGDSTGTVGTFYKLYTLNLESSDSTVTVVGLARFQLAIDTTNLWSIVEWNDFRTDSIYIDWSILKAKSR